MAIAILAVIALVQKQRADDRARLALSRQLAANARAEFDDDPQLSLLLALDAYDTLPTDESAGALRAVLLRRGLVQLFNTIR